MGKSAVSVSRSQWQEIRILCFLMSRLSEWIAPQGKSFGQESGSYASEGKTVLFSTHYLQEADDVATRILLFNKGKLIADGSPSTIKQRLLKKTVSFKCGGIFPKEQFLTMDHVSDIQEEKGRIVIQTDDTDHVLSSLFTEGIPISDISIDKGRLEDAFEQLTVEQGVS